MKPWYLGAGLQRKKEKLSFFRLVEDNRRSPMKSGLEGTHSLRAQHTTATRRPDKRKMLLLSTRLGREGLCVQATLTFAFLFAPVVYASGGDDTKTLIEALCNTPSWELADTLVSLPMFGDNALKASSRFPGLRRFSPSQGNLSVRPRLPKCSLSGLFFVSTLLNAPYHPISSSIPVTCPRQPKPRQSH